MGLLPEREQLEQFLKDKSPDKRTRWVDQLLADEMGYAEHWLTFWNDLLRNDYDGTVSLPWSQADQRLVV